MHPASRAFPRAAYVGRRTEYGQPPLYSLHMSLLRAASAQSCAALHPLGLRFDSFLYAEVGDDQRGGALSVISALARVGVDPWEEAARLARLPLHGAVRTLSALLARLPAGSGQPADPALVATRLVRLLPHTSTGAGPPNVAATGTRNHGIVSKHCRAALLYVVTMVLLVGALLLARH